MLADRHWGLAAALVAVCCVVAPPSVLLGQQRDLTPAPNSGELSSEPLPLSALRESVAHLQAELHREQAFLKLRQANRAVEVEQRRDQRRRLADELLNFQLESDRNRAKLQALAERRDELRNEAEEAQEEAASIRPALRTTVERLRLHLEQLPGQADALRRLETVAAALSSGDAMYTSPQLASTVQNVLQELDSAHQSATRLTVRHVSLFGADGLQQDVKLLTVGHLRFAYQSVSNNQVALALSSPRDTGGYRWTTQLAPGIQESLRHTIATVESGRGELVSPRLDLVGRVQAPSLQQDLGLIARLRAGGPVMWPLAGVALVALVLIAERLLIYYGRNPPASRLAGQVLAACQQGDIQQAATLCQRGTGAVARVLAACLGRQELGQRAMEDSIQEQLLHELPKLERFMGGIAILAAVAPLLGLLGTVTGIISTFGVIQAFGNANPSLMAGGISEALLTTATGLVVAVPILIVHSVLRGRADRIVADAERHAASLLTLLAASPAARMPSAPGVEVAPVPVSEAPARDEPEQAASAAESQSPPAAQQDGKHKRKRSPRGAQPRPAGWEEPS